MSSVSGRTRRRAARRGEGEFESQREPRRSRPRAAKRILIGLALLALFVWFLPMIAAHSPLRNRAAAIASADLDGRLSIGSASLGWLSPVVLEDIELSDRKNDPVATAPRIASQRSLLGLLLDMRNLGEFRIESPRIKLLVREDGSNLEDVLAPLLAKPTDPDAEPVGLRLVVEDGEIEISDTVTKRDWTVKDLKLIVAAPLREDEPYEVYASAKAPHAGGAGNFSLDGKVYLPADDAIAAKSQPGVSLGSGEVTLEADKLPLALVQPALRRAVESCQLDGSADARLRARWGKGVGPSENWVEGQFSVEQLLFAAPAIGGDEVRLARLDAPCHIVQYEKQWEIKKLELNCDVGRMSIAGAIDRPANGEALATTQGVMKLLSRAAGDVSGELDLAKLAKLMPETLCIREGTQLRSGMVRLALHSGPGDKAWEWSGKLDAERLVAAARGRDIAWEHPIELSFDAHDDPKGLAIDRLFVASDFLELEGSGTADYFSVTSSYNLNRLANELDAFVDLGETRFAGDGWSHIVWQRQPNGAFAADAEMETTDFEYSRPGAPAWVEPKLELTASATGAIEDDAPKRIETAWLSLIAGDDRLDAAVRSAVDRPFDGAVWPLDARLAGSLARWLVRARPWYQLPEGWSIDGQADLTAQASLSNKEFNLTAARGVVDNLHFWGAGLYVDEPRVEANGTARLSSDPPRFEIRQASLTTPAAIARIEQFAHEWNADGSTRETGRATVQGDLARMQRWLQNPNEPANWDLAGRINGAADVAAADGKNKGQLNLTIDNFIAQPTSGGQQWRERQLRLTAAAVHDSAADRLDVSTAKLDSSALGLDAAGTLTRLSTDRVADLRGGITYDWAQLVTLLRPYVGDNVVVRGRETRQFALSGPLAPQATTPGAAPPSTLASLSGEASMGWQSADVFGFAIGPADLRTRLSRGLLQVEPLDLVVSQGRLRTAPALRLDPLPMLLTLPAGPTLDRVQITPEMCNEWMMFVAPVMAGVTQASGAFSLALDGAEIPVLDPAAGDAAGNVTVHSVDIGPGPLVQELAVLMGRPAGARLQRESKVDFRLVNGRVYHRNLEMVFPEFTVRTHGSVGLDQSLAILAEMPVPPKWIGNNALGAALKNQTLQLPINGTLHQPKIDKQALDRYAAQFLRNAGSDAIRNELNRQLDRLLPLK